MWQKNINDFERVVAIGGGHGMGRVLSSLSFLGTRLTGIVTTTDDGGSTGRLRKSQECIAWGDLRNCLNQLVTEPSIGSQLFEYRFTGRGELAGHNLGNLMLLALDNLCVRPLDAIRLISDMLEIELAYAIGVAEPVSVEVYTFGTGKIPDAAIKEIVKQVFDLRPGAIIKNLDLRRPIYQQLAAYGHFGRNELNLPWEELNKVEEIKVHLQHYLG